ncbi:hypothetical protein CRUP_016474 [Coryphaenoides rupestris]|nr:hypothetical protein CRUP_016474 [Coryphaenoides rupestris]
MGEYEPKIEVQFSESLHVTKGSSVKLECFALGNPVPSILWRRADGSPLAGKIQINHSNGVLEVPYFRPEDEGVYEQNNVSRVFVFKSPDVEHLQWLQTLKDANVAVEANLQWECQASGKPTPTYRWLKNGQPLAAGDRIHMEDGRLALSSVALSDSGMYQCLAEHEHGAIYASAELKVVGKSRAIMDDGSLRITNVSQSDAGRYTCVARNTFGASSSSGSLVSVVLPCQVSSDPTLEPTFKWFLNGKPLDLELAPRREHFELIGGVSAGDLMVRNVQLKHSGKYVCMVHTAVDSVSAAAELIVRGPPGAPVEVVVSKITDTGVQLSWGSGPDNHSPVTSYALQARTPYSVGWQTAQTVPDCVPGQMLHASVTGLKPWVEHEFRVVALNAVGVGEPSVRAIMDDGSLRITNVSQSDAGRYTCVARNTFGASSSSGSLVSVVLPCQVSSDPTLEPTFKWFLNGKPLDLELAPRREHFELIGGVSAGDLMVRNVQLKHSGKYVCMVHTAVDSVSAAAELIVRVPDVAPVNVSGGGGSGGELVISWEPVPEEQQGGEDLGYIVAFRQRGASDRGPWTQAVLASPDASRYVYWNDSIMPLSQYEVKTVGQHCVVLRDRGVLGASCTCSRQWEDHWI